MITAQGDRENADAVLQVSVLANYKLYEEMKRRDSRMCEAMRMLMKDEIGEAEREGREAGRETGREEGDIAAIKNMYELGIDVQKICTKYPGALVERALGASALHAPS